MTSPRQTEAEMLQAMNATPRVWWRRSPLPECSPCVTVDPDEAAAWHVQGHDVRELTEPAAPALVPAEERPQFEAAMAREGYELNPGRYRDGTYCAPYYAAGWAMWQARATPLASTEPGRAAGAEWSPAPECDSPRICELTSGCAGRYDTRKRCSQRAAQASPPEAQEPAERLTHAEWMSRYFPGGIGPVDPVSPEDAADAGVREAMREVSERAGQGVALPAVPSRVLQHIHAYGDARSDDDGTSPAHLAEVIRELREWAAALAHHAPTAGAATTEPVTMPAYWSVDVNADGENIVSIGHDWLSGSRAIEQGDERTILGAAQHLLAFIGYGLPPCNFNPDEDETAGAAQGERS